MMASQIALYHFTDGSGTSAADAANGADPRHVLAPLAQGLA
jgi:hypothetical protein